MSECDRSAGEITVAKRLIAREMPLTLLASRCRRNPKCRDYRTDTIQSTILRYYAQQGRQYCRRRSSGTTGMNIWTTEGREDGASVDVMDL